MPLFINEIENRTHKSEHTSHPAKSRASSTPLHSSPTWLQIKRTSPSKSQPTNQQGVVAKHCSTPSLKAWAATAWHTISTYPVRITWVQHACEEMKDTTFKPHGQAGSMEAYVGHHPSGWKPKTRLTWHTQGKQPLLPDRDQRGRTITILMKRMYYYSL